MKKTRNVMITGGAGFIGSHLVKYLKEKHPDWNILVYDALTYAGDLKNLDNTGVPVVKGAIQDRKLVKRVLYDYTIDTIIHLAAESHVDNSLSNPLEFVETNVLGTVTLLQAANEWWNSEQFRGHREPLFYHVSTDEVYGQLHSITDPPFTEYNTYDPSSPYSASKAASDHFVRAYARSFGIPVLISHCSNNFGTHQFPEKLIPVVINKILNNEDIPVYGHGDNIRDWLWVKDHCSAIDFIIENGTIGESYNIGGNNEIRNLDLVIQICNICDELLHRTIGHSERLIRFVKDRPGHDYRYAINSSKLQALGWKPTKDFDNQLRETVQWYITKFFNENRN